jgi:hypothetical protein
MDIDAVSQTVAVAPCGADAADPGRGSAGPVDRK